MTGSIYLNTAEQSVGETDGQITVTIRRIGDTSGTVHVNFGITSDNATIGADFLMPGSLTATIPAGEDSVQVPITIVDDGQSEPTESFVLSLISVDSGSIIAPRTERISILDDENPAPPSEAPQLISIYNVDHEAVITGLNQPIRFAYSPIDSNVMYIAEKGGAIKVFNTQTGAQLSTFIDLSAQVNEFQDRGLLDIALHPDFANNPYVYAFYVVDPADVSGSAEAGADGAGNRYAYVVRYTADIANGYMTVVPGSGVIIEGGTGLTLADVSGNGAIDSTNDLGPVASDKYDNPGRSDEVFIGGYKQNYIKVDSESHAGGSLAFGPDGKLYISIGDGVSFNMMDPRGLSVQDLNSLAGKILRVDPITGQGLADNPFASTASGGLSSNQAKVYQLGLRNPFSMGFDSTGQLFITTTGWDTYEDIVSGPAGANFGWPFYEGGDGGVLNPTNEYENLPEAQDFYAAVDNHTINVLAPYRAFAHSSTVAGFHLQCITGGDVVYTGNRYPIALQNDYFFSDFYTGNVFTVDTNDRRDVKFLFNSGSGFGPVHFSQGPDGYIYYVDLVNGEIDRLLISALPAPFPRTLLATGSTVQIATSPAEYILTHDQTDQLGTVMSSTRINLDQNFTIAFSAYFGINANGADGLGFVLHNDTYGPYSHGGGGGSFGLQGISDGLAIAFDTYQNDGEPANDNTFFLNTATGVRSTAVELGELENGIYHPVVVTWNATTKTLSYSIDGTPRGTITDSNFFNTYLGGSNYAYFGFAAATGGAANQQMIRITTENVTWEVVSQGTHLDFSNDRKEDIALQNTNGQMRIWLQNGLAIDTDNTLPTNPGALWRAKLTGEFNGDGSADILFQNSSTGQVSMWIMNGLATQTADLVHAAAGPTWHIITIGDFNNDLRSDLVLQNDNSNVAVWMMNGLDLVGGDQVAGSAAGGWVVKGTGDFNGDKKADLLFQNSNTSQVAVWLMDGLALIGGDAIHASAAGGWQIKGTADFNGDGKSDILFQNSNTSQAAVWLMNGLNLVGGDSIAASAAGGWSVMGGQDLDGDSKADILLQNADGRIAAWLMNGLSVTGANTIANPGASWLLIPPTGS